jgi:hypothetical protein
MKRGGEEGGKTGTGAVKRNALYQRFFFQREEKSDEN